jgi:PIN domain nuclease of toxin-antitoxin system
MNVLLDTHTMIWFFEGADELSPTALQTIENDGNTCLIRYGEI